MGRKGGPNGSSVDIQSFVGYKVGSLTVVKFLEEKWLPSGKRYDHYYLCKCKCGREQPFIRRVLNSTPVVKRNSICCNECQKTRMKNNRVAIKYDNDIDRHIGIVYSNYKSKCKTKNWEFDLLINEFKDLVLQDCWYCGLKPNNYRRLLIGPKSYSRQYISGIDRIDSSKGYVLSNCRPCCEDCNLAKRQLSEKQFFELIERIYIKHFQSRT